MRGIPHWLRLGLTVCLLLALGLACAPPAAAQQSGVQLNDLRAGSTGLGGLIRRGNWTPVRLDLFNESVEVRGVVCRWLLTDDDGDRVIAERRADLTPQRDQAVWLYANPPLNAPATSSWTFQVVDADTNELLAQQTATLSPDVYMPPTVGVVGICGVEDMGLQPYTRWATSHERTVLALGLDLETLPDRWYGLSILSTLVWGPNDSGDPNSTAMSETTRHAVREWVYRGGHLVVVLPDVGETWTSSGLSDVLGPIGPAEMEQIEAVPPALVFGQLKARVPMPMTAFDPPEDAGYTTLITATVGEGDTAEQKPVVVSRRYGFGQVTIVGIDLTNRLIYQSVDGFLLHKMWTRILGWRASKNGSLFRPSYLDSRQGENRLIEAERIFKKAELGGWVGDRVAKQATAGPAIGLAVVLFIVYWAVALVSFPTVLRGRGWDRFSWLIFLTVIGVFSAVAWGGAALLRPAKTSATHFTVLDIDGNKNIVHARSWVSLFVPRFDDVSVAVPSDRDGILPNDLTNVISSPGMGLSLDRASYVDPQTYAFDAGRPDDIAFPIRATTKPLVIDFLGQITGQREGLDQPLRLPVPKNLHLADNGLPTGSITHQFDGDLTDVLIIYCPGGSGQARDASWKPLVWRYRNAQGLPTWSPNAPLVLPTSTSNALRLWNFPDESTPDRYWNREGFLGEMVASRNFGPGNGTDNNLIYDTTLLSFFDAVPPPLVERDGSHGMQSDFAVYERTVLRGLDMTALTTGRRLIIIGHLRDSRAPLPLSVEGETVPTEGWTVVRWIYDL